MSKLRTFFSPALGSRARNIARAVLPALVLLNIVELSAEQIAAVALAVEVIFSGGGEISRRF